MKKMVAGMINRLLDRDQFLKLLICLNGLPFGSMANRILLFPQFEFFKSIVVSPLGFSGHWLLL